MLIIKYSSTVMQGKRKLCECQIRFFFEIEKEKMIWKFPRSHTCPQINSDKVFCFSFWKSGDVKQNKTRYQKFWQNINWLMGLKINQALASSFPYAYTGKNTCDLNSKS